MKYEKDQEQIKKEFEKMPPSEAVVLQTQLLLSVMEERAPGARRSSRRVIQSGIEGKL